MLSTKNYSIKPWSRDSIIKHSYHSSWKDIFDILLKDERYDVIIKNIQQTIIESEGKKQIFPYPELVFNAFNYTSLDDIKVVILGMDPYFNKHEKDGQIIPEAMGLSFSIPIGIPIPSSLRNIYKNLLKYNHIEEIPKHGNLTFWACQGCLMLNSALTVVEKQVGSHLQLWNWFTDSIIQYVNDKCKNVVFVFWGAPALTKSKFVNLEKHKMIASSHPSGLSCNKPLRCYPPFDDFDHFGQINKMLKKSGKKQIIWKL